MLAAGAAGGKAGQLAETPRLGVQHRRPTVQGEVPEALKHAHLLPAAPQWARGRGWKGRLPLLPLTVVGEGSASSGGTSAVRHAAATAMRYHFTLFELHFELRRRSAAMWPSGGRGLLACRPLKQLDRR